MGKVSENFLVAFLIVSFFMILIISLGSSYVSESLYIVKQPLFTIKIWSAFLLLWNAGGFFAAQGYPKFKPTYAGIGAILAVLSTIFFHLLAVLYGAPLFETVGETFHLACLLTVTAVVPCLCGLGLNSDTWTRVFALNRCENSLEQAVQIISIFSIVGAWLGAFPIPLDWDRPWQVWPISCALGSLGGHALGHLVSSCVICDQARKVSKIKLG